MNIKLYWVRHGYSCANSVRDTIGSTDIRNAVLSARSTYAPDAALSNYGITQAEMGKKLNKDLLAKADIIISSELRRAMETALILFDDYLTANPDKRVYPVPYINEEKSSLLNLFGLDKDNSAMPLPELKKYFANSPIFKDKAKKLDFSILEEIKPATKSSKTESPDIDKFFKIVMPILIKKFPTIFVKGRTVNIFIVSHHKFIETQLKKIVKKEFKIPYINNVDIWVENIVYDYDEKKKSYKITNTVPEECVAQKTKVCQAGDKIHHAEKLDANSYANCDPHLRTRLGETSYSPKEAKKAIKKDAQIQPVSRLPGSVGINASGLSTGSSEIGPGVTTGKTSVVTPTASTKPVATVPSVADQKGGKDVYYHKYVKYKYKYIQFKNKL